MRASLSIALFSACAACGPRLLPAGYAKQDVLAFVQLHRAELQEQAKRGSGAAVRDLGVTAGCQNIPELQRRLQKNHEQIFATVPATDPEVAERIVTTLTKSPELRCLDLELGRGREYAAGTRHIGPRRYASYR